MIQIQVSVKWSSVFGSDKGYCIISRDWTRKGLEHMVKNLCTGHVDIITPLVTFDAVAELDVDRASDFTVLIDALSRQPNR